jgi:hypothetical protein
MAFEGPGRCKDTCLDDDERLRLHETVHVRHADHGRLEHALMGDAVHSALRSLRSIE